VVDALDIDLLLRAPAGNGAVGRDGLFDLNFDDQVINTKDTTASDADLWVRTLKQTEYGDANLDGAVEFTDLLIVASDYGETTGTWAQGDFNGDDVTDFFDLLPVAQNYGTFPPTVAGGFSTEFIADWNRALALVPEPTALLGVASVATVLVRRRRP
jgi:hypothetical protein